MRIDNRKLEIAMAKKCLSAEQLSKMTGISTIIATEKDWYRIMTELDEDYLFPPEVFEVVPNFTVQQITFMKGLGLKLDFDNLTDDDLIQIEETVGEKLQKSGFDRNNEVTADGRMCESILDRLS